MIVDPRTRSVAFSTDELAKVQERIQTVYNSCMADGSRTADIAINMMDLADLLNLRLVSGREQREITGK